MTPLRRWSRTVALLPILCAWLWVDGASAQPAGREARRAADAASSPSTVGLLAGVTMTAEAGLGSRLKLGKWAPVRCVLFNDTGREVRGVVAVELPASDKGTHRYTVHVNLPSPSKRAATMYIRPTQYLDEIPVKFTAADGSGVIEQRITVVTQMDSTPVALTVTKRDIGLRRATTFGSMTHIDVADARLRDLPDRAIGYGPVDVLIADGVSFRNLTPEQERALRHWVLDGGRLVVAGGRHSDLIPGTVLDDLLPVTVGRQFTRTVATEKTALRKRGYGAIKVTVPATEKPVVIARCKPRPDADVLVEDSDGLPLIVSRKMGEGGVMFLAFDLSSAPMLTNERLPALYRGILQWTGLISPDYDRSFPRWMLQPPEQSAQISAAIQAAVYQTAATTVPPLSSLALFLGAYVLVVGPLDYLLLKRLRRRHWTLVTFPLIVAGFTYAAYYAASQFKGRQVFVNEINVVRQRGNSAHVHGYVGVYSPKTATYDIVLRDPSAAILPLASPGLETSEQAVLPYIAPTQPNPPQRQTAVRIVRRGGGTVTYRYYGPGGTLLQVVAKRQSPLQSVLPWGGPVPAAEPFGEPYVTRYDPESAALADTPIDMWAMRTFFADWWLDAGGVTSDLTLKDDRIRGSVRNGTRFDLSDCLLVFEGIPIPIGDLPKGKTTRLNLDVSQRAQRERLSGEDVISGADEEEKAARTAALAGLTGPVAGMEYATPICTLSYPPSSGQQMAAHQQPMLIGWSREPLLPIEVAGHDPGRRAVSMWVADVKIEGWKPKEQAMVYYY